MIRAIFHIARRDFSATIFSRGFLIWLLTPVIGFAIITVGVMFSGASPEREAARTVVLLDGGGAAKRLRDAAARLEKIGFDSPRVVVLKAWPDPAVQAGRRLGSDKTRLVLHIGDPALRDVRLYAAVPVNDADMRFMRLLLSDARRLSAQDLAAPASVGDDAVLPVSMIAGGGRTVDETRPVLATGATMILFTLIGLLAGSLLTNMVEEKANKVIEVLVACVPIPAIFAGKLLGMLAISLIGIAVWGALFGTAALVAVAQLPVGALPVPGVGWSALLMLGIVYLITAYLLFGAIYLGLGSLCSSIREVQSLSMPVTIAQTVVIVGVLRAINNHDGLWAQAMTWFPLSSPYMMLARAAMEPGLAAHALAIGWQFVCAMLVIGASAQLFRRGVLRSGPPPSLFGLMRGRL